MSALSRVASLDLTHHRERRRLCECTLPQHGRSAFHLKGSYEFVSPVRGEEQRERVSRSMLPYAMLVWSKQLT